MLKCSDQQSDAKDNPSIYANKRQISTLKRGKNLTGVAMAGTQSESCYLSHLLNTRRILLFEFHQNLWQTSFMPDKVRVNYYCSCHDDRRGLNKTQRNG